MSLIAITYATGRRAKVQPKRHAGLQVEQLSLTYFVLIWKLCKRQCAELMRQLFILCLLNLQGQAQ